MGTEWIFLMTIIFGIISLLLKKKYVLEGEVKKIYFPPIYKKTIYICFFLSMLFAGIMIFIYQVIDIAVFFNVLGIICLLAARSVGRYCIVVDKERLIITPFVGSRKSVGISQIECLEKNYSGSIKIIVNGQKIVTLDSMLIGVEEFIQLLQEKGVVLRLKKETPAM